MFPLLSFTLIGKKNQNAAMNSRALTKKNRPRISTGAGQACREGTLNTEQLGMEKRKELDPGLRDSSSLPLANSGMGDAAQFGNLNNATKSGDHIDSRLI